MTRVCFSSSLFFFWQVAFQLSQHPMLKCFGNFVKNQLTMNVKVYLGPFCVPVLMSVMPCLVSNDLIQLWWDWMM